jgi:death on curing protein
MKYLTIKALMTLYDRVIATSGGSSGIRDLGLIESALKQPRQTFGGEELYPTVEDKASLICFALVKNHPFVDGNKRIGHAAMEKFLEINGYKFVADTDEQEATILALASGNLTREELLEWVRAHIVEA